MKFSSLLAASAAVMLLAPLPAPAATGGGLSLPVVGRLDGGGTFTGSFTLQRFAMQGEALVAVGQVSGVLTDATGVARTVFKTTSVPVSLSAPTATQISCGILHLELGPLDLDLLGLVVHLDKVVLDISAEPGAGNLLGNLLCAITGLLDSPGLRLVKLLNDLLAILVV